MKGKMELILCLGLLLTVGCGKEKKPNPTVPLIEEESRARRENAPNRDESPSPSQPQSSDEISRGASGTNPHSDEYVSPRLVDVRVLPFYDEESGIERRFSIDQTIIIKKYIDHWLPTSAFILQGVSRPNFPTFIFYAEDATSSRENLILSYRFYRAQRDAAENVPWKIAAPQPDQQDRAGREWRLAMDTIKVGPALIERLGEERWRLEVKVTDEVGHETLWTLSHPLVVHNLGPSVEISVERCDQQDEGVLHQRALWSQVTSEPNSLVRPLSLNSRAILKYVITNQFDSEVYLENSPIQGLRLTYRISGASLEWNEQGEPAGERTLLWEHPGFPLRAEVYNRHGDNGVERASSENRGSKSYWRLPGKLQDPNFKLILYFSVTPSEATAPQFSSQGWTHLIHELRTELTYPLTIVAGNPVIEICPSHRDQQENYPVISAVGPLLQSFIFVHQINRD